MLTNGLIIAREYFNDFRSMVEFYFAYFSMLKT